MQTLQQILTFLINLFGSLYLCIILLRFLLQTARADFYNPISQVLVKLTNPVLIPLRRIIPGFWGIDFASLVLAILVHWLVMQILILVAQGGPIVGPHLMLVWALISLSLNIITIYLFAGFILFITSFLAPYSRHPAIVLVHQLLEPLLAPVRRFVPPVGGLDFSLFFVGIFLVVLRMVVIGIGNNLRVPFGYLIGYTG
ncbi:YggT family protein [Saccharophagus sp. K07]|jgi:YggT family protein|uniref:YggT family protein n=1 Tax=Saccharophagus sp. K07 TaxID=2283636 RepID=UPI00165246BC|nr:YggT family protein [Saccharophagus sp. K07]MBC6906039.1 YggT family protein [Saccharophagus sp. K07]